MPTCFVMQPFDRGAFDKRYEDVYKPAIVAAGFDAYRVDRDPAASIPIEDIETGIRAADICLADITLDNPNVWFELGYAIAVHKEVVLVCADSRATRFPFDIQHRTVTTYSTESPRDFETLHATIKERITALHEKTQQLMPLTALSAASTTAGLADFEIAALVTIAANAETPGSPVAAYTVRRDCEQAGYTNIAVALAINSLQRYEYIQPARLVDDHGEEFAVYHVTSRGIQWLEANKDRLILRSQPAVQMDPDHTPF